MATVAIVPLIELALPTVISTFSRYGPGIEIINQSTTNIQAVTWGTVDHAQLYQITLSAPFTIRSLLWRSGTASVGNYDFGVYDHRFSLLRSIGSTPAPLAGSNQTLPVTPLSLQPGNYWLAFVSDNAAFAILGRVPFSASAAFTSPIRGAAASFPLPQTVTPVKDLLPFLQPLAITSEV